MTVLSEGNTAPEFDLTDADGEAVRLETFRGQPLVLYFYPRDETPGCTTEAIDFSALAPNFAEFGATVVGVSPDSPESHKRFRQRHDLTVRLLADPDHRTASAYGAWGQKSMYGRTFDGIIRSTFLIDASGTVRRIWRKVRVPGHAAAVLAGVEEICRQT